MPELPEGLAHYLAAMAALESLGTACLRVIAIWADLTKKEAERAKVPIGMIQKLTPQTRIRRGTYGQQTPLLAEALQHISGNPSPIPISQLEIKGVHHSVRALIVDLGPVWL